nr:hypothetical protein [Tanacetum cinerariifolium]
MRGEKVVPAAAVGDIDGLVMPAVVVAVLGNGRRQRGVVMVAVGVVVVSAAVGQRRWRGWRVRGGGVWDRKVRIIFGFAGKSPPEKFSGGGDWPAVVVAAGDFWG